MATIQQTPPSNANYWPIGDQFSHINYDSATAGLMPTSKQTPAVRGRHCIVKGSTIYKDIKSTSSQGHELVWEDIYPLDDVRGFCFQRNPPRVCFSKWFKILEMVWDLNVTVTVSWASKERNLYMVTACIDFGREEPNYGISNYFHSHQMPNADSEVVLLAIENAAEDWCHNMLKECMTMISDQNSNPSQTWADYIAPELYVTTGDNLRIPRQVWNKLMHAQNGNTQSSGPLVYSELPGYMYVSESLLIKSRSLCPPAVDPTNPAYGSGPQPSGEDKTVFFVSYANYVKGSGLSPSPYLAQNAWNIYITANFKPKAEPIMTHDVVEDWDWMKAAEPFEAMSKSGIFSYKTNLSHEGSPHKPVWSCLISLSLVGGMVKTFTVRSKSKDRSKVYCQAILLCQLLGVPFEPKLNLLILAGDVELNPGPTQAAGRNLASIATFGVSHVVLVSSALLGKETSSVSMTMTMYKPGAELGDLGNLGFLVYWKRDSALPNLVTPASGTPFTYLDSDYVVVYSADLDISPLPPTPDTQSVGPIVTKGVSSTPYSGSANRCLCASFWNGCFQESNFAVSWILTKVPSITPGLDLTRYGIEPNPGPVVPFTLIAAGESSFASMIATALKNNKTKEDTVFYAALVELLDFIDPSLSHPFIKSAVESDQVETDDSISADPSLKGGPPRPYSVAGLQHAGSAKPAGTTNTLPQPPTAPVTEKDREADRKAKADHMMSVATRISGKYNTWSTYTVWLLRQKKISLDFLSITMPKTKITAPDLVCLELIFSKIGHSDLDSKFSAFWNTYRPENVIVQNEDFFQPTELAATGLKVTYTDEYGCMVGPSTPKYKIVFRRAPTSEELQSIIEKIRKKRAPQPNVMMETNYDLGGWLEDLSAFGCVEKNPGPEEPVATGGTTGTLVNPTMESLMSNKSTIAAWRAVTVDKSKMPIESFKLYQALSGADASAVPPAAQYSAPDIISYNAVDPVAAPAGISTYEVFTAGLLLPRSTRSGGGGNLVDSNQRLAFIAIQGVLKPGIKLIRTQLADQVVNISRGEALLALRPNIVLANWYPPIDLFKYFVAQMEGEFCPEMFLIKFLLAMYNSQWIQMGKTGGSASANWVTTQNFPWVGEAGKWDNSVLPSEANGGTYEAEWNNEFSTVIFNEDCGGNDPVFPFRGGEKGSVTFAISIASLKSSVNDANIIFILPSLLALFPNEAGKAIAMTLMMFCETWGILSCDINTRANSGANLNNQRFTPFSSQVFYPGRTDFGVMLPRSQIGQAPTTSADAQRFAEYVIKTGPRTTQIPADTVLNYASDQGSQSQSLTDFILSWADSISVEDWTSFAKVHQAVFGFTRSDWNYANEAVAVLASRFNFNICTQPDLAQPFQPHNTGDSLIQNTAYMQTVRKLPDDNPNGSFPYTFYPGSAGFAVGDSNLADYNKVVTGVSFPEKLPQTSEGAIFPTGLFTTGSIFALKYVAQKHAAMCQVGFAAAQMPIGAITTKIDVNATAAFKAWNLLLFSGSSASARGFSTVQPTPLGRVFAATAQKALAHADSIALDRSGAPFLSFQLKGSWLEDPQIVKNWTGATFSNFDVGRPRLLSDAQMSFHVENAPRAFALLPPGGGTTVNLKGLKIPEATFFNLPAGGYLGYAKSHGTGSLPQRVFPYTRWTDEEILDHRIADVITGRSVMGAALNGAVAPEVLTTGQTKLPGTIWKVWFPAADYQMPTGNGVTYNLTVRSWQGASDWLPPATITGKLIYPYFSSIAAIKGIIFGSQIAGVYSTILFGSAFTPSQNILDDYADVDPHAGYDKSNFEDTSKAAFTPESGVGDVRPTAGLGVTEQK